MSLRNLANQVQAHCGKHSSKWFHVLLVSALAVSTLQVGGFAQYAADHPYGAGQYTMPRYDSPAHNPTRFPRWRNQWNYNRRNDQRMPYNNVVRLQQAELKSFRDSVESFANQLAAIWLLQDRTTTSNSDEARLNQELQILRQQASSLLANNSGGQHFQYWHSQLQDLTERTYRMDRYIATSANHALTFQRWQRVKSDLDRLRSSLYCAR